MRKDCVFIHVPKTGGTSVRTTLRIRHRNKITQTTHVPWGTECMRNHVKRLNNPVVFSCVRNPYTRAVSVFNHFKRRMHRANRMNYLLEAATQSFTLNQFWLVFVNRDMFKWVPHLRPQHTFLEGAPLKYLMKFERLEEDFKKVYALIRPGAALDSVHFPKLNSSTLTWSVKDLSNAARSRIYDYYAEDFERYGYSPKIDSPYS